VNNDVRAVNSANRALYAAVESGDLDLMGAVWLDGAYADDVVCVHPGWAPLRGRSEVMRSWAAIMAGTSYIQFFLTDVVVRVTDDIALVTCAENILTGTDDAGDGLGFAGGRVVATNLFRRTSDGWRLWVHHASPVVPDMASGQDLEEDAE
jgi:ketosteroid isomerase-like protein